MTRRAAFAAAFAAALAALLLGAAALMSAGLARSLWYDELYSAQRFMSEELWQSVSTARAANNHPGYSLLANLSRRLIPAEPGLRLPALLAALGAILAAALTGRALRGPGAGLIAGLLTATAPGLVLMGAEARGYSAAACAGMLALAAPALCSERRAPWLIALATGLGLWCHAAAGLWTLGIALPWLRPAARHDPRARRLLLGALAGHLLALLLYLRILKRMWSFARRNVLQDARWDPLATLAEALRGAAIWDGPWLLGAAIMGLAALGGWGLWRDGGARRELAARMLGGLALSLGFWLLPGTFFVRRFVIILAPPLLLCAGLGLAELIAALRPRLGALPAAGLGLALLLALGGMQLREAEAKVRAPRQDLRGAITLAQAWRAQWGGRIVGVGLGAELLSGYAGEPIPALAEDPSPLEGWRAEGPVILIEPFEAMSIAPLRRAIDAAPRRQRLEGWGARVRVAWLPGIPRMPR